MVVVGLVAKFGIKQYLGRPGRDRRIGRVEVAGKERLLVLVPHPSSFGGPRPRSVQLSPELAQVRRPLAGSGRQIR
jgi:hypothetical protein